MSETRERHEQRLKRDPSPLIQQAYGAPHIAADKANFHNHIAAHRAHTVMLVQCGIISAGDGAAILRALDGVEAGGVESIPIRP
jgi:argininosuccinate lyase